MVVLALVLIALLTGAKAWYDTMRDPLVQRLDVILPGMGAGNTPLTIALLADIHVAGPDMPPARLARIVAQVNALSPDLVLIAGDLVSDKTIATRHYSTHQAIAPLAQLSPALAVVAVPGNHDHWRDMDAVRQALEEAGIIVLANQAQQIGPLVIGGLDDDFTGHDDLPQTLSAMERLPGGRIVLSHSPDPFPGLPSHVGLMLAGHTHCGQIGWPWGGSPAHMSRYGQRYACGVVEEDSKILLTSGGLGTSVLPFRLFTQPEIWLVTVRPPED